GAAHRMERRAVRPATGAAAVRPRASPHTGARTVFVRALTGAAPVAGLTARRSIRFGLPRPRLTGSAADAVPPALPGVAPGWPGFGLAAKGRSGHLQGPRPARPCSVVTTKPPPKPDEAPNVASADPARLGHDGGDPQATATGVRILLVEDDLPLAELLADYLRSN